MLTLLRKNVVSTDALDVVIQSTGTPATRMTLMISALQTPITLIDRAVVEDYRLKLRFSRR